MSSEISTNVSFSQEITNKVRQLIMNAMPEEKLKEILEKEYKEFFLDKTDRWDNTSKSPFTTMVRNEINVFFKEAIKEQVKSYLTPLFQGSGSEATIAILAEITPEVQKAMAKSIAMESAQYILSSLQNRTY